MLQPTYKQEGRILRAHVSREGRMTLDTLMGYYSGVYACVDYTLGGSGRRKGHGLGLAAEGCSLPRSVIYV